MISVMLKSQFVIVQQFDLKSIGPVVEVYAGGYTRYIAPLENNEGFFVPEIAQQQESKKEQ